MNVPSSALKTFVIFANTYSAPVLAGLLLFQGHEGVVNPVEKPGARHLRCSGHFMSEAGGYVESVPMSINRVLADWIPALGTPAVWCLKSANPRCGGAGRAPAGEMLAPTRRIQLTKGRQFAAMLTRESEIHNDFVVASPWLMKCTLPYGVGVAQSKLREP
jgi:hypothetical protein